MKRIKIFSAVAVGLLALASCSEQMNYNEYYVYDRDYMTQEFGRVEGFLTTAYNEMDYDYGGYYSNALMASSTDESE